MAKSFIDNAKKAFKHYFRQENRSTAIVTVVIAVVVIAALGYYFTTNPQSGTGINFSALRFWAAGDSKIAQNAVDYINDNGLANSEVTLKSYERTSGVIKIKIDIAGTEYESFISTDGKYLFPSAIEITPTEGSETPPDEVSTTSVSTCEDLTKTDNPELDVYVVSQCPYGLQIQRAIAQAVLEAPELANYVKVRYIGSAAGDTITSMHGEEEATENLKQICIREEQPAKYWNYVSCYMKAGASDSCLVTAGVDTGAVSACMSDSSRGVAYASEDFNLGVQYGIQGSPTLMLADANVDESGFGGRSADAIKQVVCCASNNQPAFCSKTLNTTSATSSFSENYEGTGSKSDASCN
jgi:hypothetical protein